MTLSNYPKNFDTNSNLYEVHDYLRAQLAEDYTPGDSSIYVYGDSEILSRFSDSDGGILTLTDQCDDVEKRAISFVYSTKTTVSSNLIYFSGIELLPGFVDVPKYKEITNVTQNVMAEHHNALKDAIINVEKFIGIKDEVARLPLEGTMEQRTNYLRYLVLAPKAWFSVGKKIGLKPSNVTFNDLSFRLGTDGTSRGINYTWTFDIDSNIFFSYFKSYSFEKLATGEVKTKINFSVGNGYDPIVEGVDFSNNFPTTYVLQKSTDGWITHTDVTTDNNFQLIYSSVKNNPEYRFLIGGGGEFEDGLTIYINLGQDVLNYTYFYPGFFEASLKVKNDFGEDTVRLKNITNVREFCPSEALIYFTKTNSQLLVGDSYNNDNYVNNRRAPITSSVNLSVLMTVSDNGEVPPDTINSYTWSLQDDLMHLNQEFTKASFSVGGLYDVVLRTDTISGNYRITTFKSSIDIVEKSNLWIWTSKKVGSGVNITANEFGLISETFKVLSGYNVSNKNNSFLGSISSNINCDCGANCCRSCYNYSEKCRKIREFDRNNGFSPIGTLGSGNISTDAVIFWATGRNSNESVSEEYIFFLRYNAFGDYYSSYNADPIQRQWGWVNFVEPSTRVHFLLGNKGNIDTSSNTFDCKNLTLNGDSNLIYDVSNILTTLEINVENSGDCCIQSFNNVQKDVLLSYSVEDYSFYRSAWKDGSGYVLSNPIINSSNPYFRIKNFYKTSGTILSPITDITKLNDMPGPIKTEGELVTLSDALYFFNNSGSISTYNTITSTWVTGGPGIGSVAFKSLQDTDVDKFDDINQTLFATSDEDHNVYISYDYSPKSFIKFNDIDLTFRYLGYRPSGSDRQWLSSIY